LSQRLALLELGLGLRSMEERARACGGTFKIKVQPNTGTEVVVQVPENWLEK
jgi:signal transduction histidine kinase